jgi:hypothetical protein
VLGEETYASRPVVDGDACDELEDQGGVDGLAQELPVGDLDIEDAVVTPHRDGSITAVVTDKNGTTTLELDSRGRLVHAEFSGIGESMGMDATIDLEYGPKAAIDVPDADHLIPAAMETEEEFDVATHTLTVTIEGSPEQPPRSEIEARVLDGFGGDVVAAFPLSQAKGSQGPVGFTYTDADGDGKVSAGDSFTLADPDWDSQFDVDHVLFDTKADGEVNSSPMGAPAPAFAWLALGMLALAVALRSRR